jgi:translation initiation factor 2-alpha kinase 3
MSPRYWACSEEELSEDSSASESTRSRDNDQSVDEEISRSEGMGQEGTGFRSQNSGTIAQVMAPDSYSRLPQRQPRQQASLFYLSLIEGRCRTQAANSINARRRPEDQLPEGHPEVSRLTHELFSDMKSELVRAGFIPEEFADNHLPDLRQYLNSFDVVLNSLATKHTSELPAKHKYRAIAGTRSLALNTNLFATSFDRSNALIQRQHNLTMSPITSVLAKLHPSLKDKVLQKSIFDTEYTKYVNHTLSRCLPLTHMLQANNLGMWWIWQSISCSTQSRSGRICYQRNYHLC